MPEQLIPGSFDGLRHHLESLPVPCLLTRIRWKAERVKPGRVRLLLETAVARVRHCLVSRDT